MVGVFGRHKWEVQSVVGDLVKPLEAKDGQLDVGVVCQLARELVHDAAVPVLLLKVGAEQRDFRHVTRLCHLGIFFSGNVNAVLQHAGRYFYRTVRLGLVVEVDFAVQVDGHGLFQHDLEIGPELLGVPHALGHQVRQLVDDDVHQDVVIHERHVALANADDDLLALVDGVARVPAVGAAI